MATPTSVWPIADITRYLDDVKERLVKWIAKFRQHSGFSEFIAEADKLLVDVVCALSLEPHHRFDVQPIEDSLEDLMSFVEEMCPDSEEEEKEPAATAKTDPAATAKADPAAKRPRRGTA